ncbi:hypothetical protein KY329_00115 [Candidatus Woesearchaeota archaeon]|nr:hypothetical protein [Candidatus Woesearchaeota archaeon]
MTEQNSKGIALVILGIVAIIAIVGLVLLFTGAKKSTGEFVVPVAKEYGGAIKGVASPYDRAFVGRSYEWDASGVEEELSGRGDNPGYRSGAQVAAYGEDMAQIGQVTENRQTSESKLQQNFIPSYGYGKACQGASETAKTLVNHPELQQFIPYTEFWSDKNVKAAYTKDGITYGNGPHGEKCVLANDILSFIGAKAREGNSMGLTYEVGIDSTPGWCCVNVGLSAEGGVPYSYTS